MALRKKTSARKTKGVRLVAKRTALTRISDVEDEIIRLDQRIYSLEQHNSKAQDTVVKPEAIDVVPEHPKISDDEL